MRENVTALRFGEGSAGTWVRRVMMIHTTLHYICDVLLPSIYKHE